MGRPTPDGAGFQPCLSGATFILPLPGRRRFQRRGFHVIQTIGLPKQPQRLKSCTSRLYELVLGCTRLYSVVLTRTPPLPKGPRRLASTAAGSASPSPGGRCIIPVFGEVLVTGFALAFGASSGAAALSARGTLRSGGADAAGKSMLGNEVGKAQAFGGEGAPPSAQRESRLGKLTRGGLGKPRNRTSLPIL